MGKQMFIYKNHRVHFCIRMQVIFTPSRLTLPLFQLIFLYALSQLCAALPACYFDSDCTSGSSYCCHEREVCVRRTLTQKCVDSKQCPVLRSKAHENYHECVLAQDCISGCCKG